jgi:hypothetical protein
LPPANSNSPDAVSVPGPVRRRCGDLGRMLMIAGGVLVLLGALFEREYFRFYFGYQPAGRTCRAPGPRPVNRVTAWARRSSSAPR